MAAVRDCTHLDQIAEVRPRSEGCADCLASGDSWVHLRMCVVCGYVGCCDQSKNRHATKHFRADGHPIIRSIEPDEYWLWCFVDRLMFELADDSEEEQS